MHHINDKKKKSIKCLEKWGQKANSLSLIVTSHHKYPPAIYGVGVCDYKQISSNKYAVLWLYIFALNTRRAKC